MPERSYCFSVIDLRSLAEGYVEILQDVVIADGMAMIIGAVTALALFVCLHNVASGPSADNLLCSCQTTPELSEKGCIQAWQCTALAITDQA